MATMLSAIWVIKCFPKQIIQLCYVPGHLLDSKVSLGFYEIWTIFAKYLINSSNTRINLYAVITTSSNITVTIVTMISAI